MKRILAVLLMVMLFVAVMPATSLAAGAVSNGDTTVYHVATQRDDLRLRSGPGTNYSILARLGKNSALIKLSGDSNGWCRVRTMNGMSGYASSQYVKKDAYADVATQRDGLNVRSDARLFDGYAYDVVVLRRGAVVMHELRTAMGLEGLLSGLAEFRRMGQSGETLTEMDFVAAMDAASGRSWEAFLTDWVFNVGDYVNQRIDWYE